MTNNIIIFLSLFISSQSIYCQTNNNFKIKVKAIPTNTVGYIKNKATSTDTIDFIYLTAFKGHVFNKITEGKSNYLYKKGDGGLTRFFGKIDSTNLRFNTSNIFNLKANDTITDVWWFLQKYDAPLYRQSNFGHAFGKLSINTTNNVITIQDVRNNTKPASNFGKLLFKVIKISPYEIILEDLQNKEKSRRYYFVKNYN